MTEAGFDRHEEHVVVPLRRKIAYGMGGLTAPLLVDINSWLMLFYNTILKLDARWVGWALFFPRFYEAITDPIMGQVSDNFRSRWGRRRPFILIGGPLCCLVFFLMWMAPAGLGEWATFLYLTVFYVLFQTMATVTMVPYAALGAELSTDFHERTRVFAWRSWFQQCGAVLIIPVYQVTHSDFFSSPRTGFIVYAGGLAVIATAAYVWVFLGTREEIEIQAQPKIRMGSAIAETFKNRPFLIITAAMLSMQIGIFFLSSFYTYLDIYYVFGGDKEAAGRLMTINGFLGMAVEIAGVPLGAWLGVKLGKRNALLVCLVLLAVSPLLTWWLYSPVQPYRQLWMALFFAPAVTGAFMLPSAMVADTVDLDELRTGRRREGMYLSLFGFVPKLAISCLTVAIGYILSWSGFSEELDVQSPDTLLRLRLIFALLPCVMGVIAIVLVLRYRLDESQVRDVRTVLEARRADKAAV